MISFLQALLNFDPWRTESIQFFANIKRKVFHALHKDRGREFLEETGFWCWCTAGLICGVAWWWTLLSKIDSAI